MLRLMPMTRGMLAGFLLGVLAGVPAMAHEEAVGRIQIDHPWALPAPAGGTTQLYMTIRNDGSRSVHFFGLKTPIAAASRIMFASPGKVGTLASITIEAECTLGLGSSHMWIELSGLKQALRIGDSFPATLEFTGYEAPITVVVEERRQPHG